MNDEGYIKIHRKILSWEWYTDTNTLRVFIHCLLMANWKDGRFMGQDIPRGSFATSYPQMAKQTKLSIQNVRTAINHLKSTGELTVKKTPKFSIITVVNYCMYQDDNRVSNRLLTDDQQASNRLLTTIEERKNKRKKEYISHRGEPHLFGVYNNVSLTDGELEELIKQYPDDYQDMIENLSTYMRSHGKLYGDHYATMMRWKHEDEIKAQEAKKAAAYDYRKDIII